MASFTLQQYCQAIARALDDLGLYAVAVSGASSVTSVDMADLTTNASTGRFNGAWVYAYGSGVQRRALKDGLTTATGQLNLNYTWTLLTAGTQIAVTRLFPMKAQVPGEDRSYADIANRALAKLAVLDRITVPITTADSISLAAYPWIDRQERIVRVLEPPPVGTRPVDAGWRGPQLVMTSGVPTLEFRAPFDVASGNLTLEVLRPGNMGADLTLDTNVGIAPLEDVVLVGLAEAYQSLMSREPGRPGGNWAVKYADAREQMERAFSFDGSLYKRRAPGDQVAA